MRYSDAERTRRKLALAGQVFKFLSEQEWNNHIIVWTFTVTQYHNVCYQRQHTHRDSWW